MAARETYDMSEVWAHTWEASEKLVAAAKDEEDCLSALCTLSGVGSWETDADGQRVYRAPCDDDDLARAAEIGAAPIDAHRPGDATLPTRVALRFGLGEVVVCKSAGYILQGDKIIDRPIYRLGDGAGAVTTTLAAMLEQDAADGEDVYWKSLEWRHLQSVVDAAGGQSERFALLAEILQRLAQARMDSETFVPYGDQFADSDFVDSI